MAKPVLGKISQWDNGKTRKNDNWIKPVKSDVTADCEGDGGVGDGVPGGKEFKRRMTEGRNGCR